MIGKTKIGKSFSGVLRYCLGNEKNAEILYKNGLTADTANSLAKEFELIQQENGNISKPVWHSSISFSDKDNITNQKMQEIANAFMKKAGFSPENNQFIVIKHNDKDHTHCHIVGNRVGFDGKAVSDSFSKSKTVSISKQLENEYNLTKVQELSKDRWLKNDLNQRNHPYKNYIKEAIDSALKHPHVNSFKDLSKELGKKNIHLDILKHAKTGKEYGVSFKMDDLAYKGSELGKHYAYKALSKLLPAELKLIKAVTKIISKGLELEM